MSEDLQARIDALIIERDRLREILWTVEPVLSAWIMVQRENGNPQEVAAAEMKYSLVWNELQSGGRDQNPGVELLREGQRQGDYAPNGPGRGPAGELRNGTPLETCPACEERVRPINGYCSACGASMRTISPPQGDTPAGPPPHG